MKSEHVDEPGVWDLPEGVPEIVDDPNAARSGEQFRLDQGVLTAEAGPEAE